MTFTTIVTVATGLTTLAGGVSLLWKWWKWKDHITDGQRCLLRSDMLHIYYHNRESGTIKVEEQTNQ